MKRFCLLLLVLIGVAALCACSQEQAPEADKTLFNAVCDAGEAMERAQNADAVVFKGLKLVSGGKVWDAFYKAAQKGKPASVLCVNYYDIEGVNMSEELYEAEKDNYPQVFFLLLEYNGADYEITVRKSDEEALDYHETFGYLKHFTGKVPSQAAYSSYDNYVLVDDPAATWEGIEAGLVSSQADAGIKHYTVYQNTFD